MGSLRFPKLIWSPIVQGKNIVLHSLQFGFRSKHSTSHTLISMTGKIRNTIDNGNYGCGIFIDLKKAFDTVNRSMVFRKTGSL